MKQAVPHEQKSHSISFGRFEIDQHSAELTVDGHCRMFRSTLSTTTLLCENPNYVFSKEEIYEKFGEHLPIMAMTTLLYSHSKTT